MDKDDPRLSQGDEYHRLVGENRGAQLAVPAGYSASGLPDELARDYRVQALVSVARGAADFLAEGAADECDIAEALRAALKPFEGP